MLWTPLKTDKHCGKTLPQVVFTDPNWFFYSHEKNWFEFNHSYEAKRLYQRARSIRIPLADNNAKREMRPYAVSAEIPSPSAGDSRMIDGRTKDD